MIEESIKSAKKTNWITRGLTKSQVKRIVFFARLKAKIQLLFLR